MNVLEKSEYQSTVSSWSSVFWVHCSYPHNSENNSCLLFFLKIKQTHVTFTPPKSTSTTPYLITKRSSCILAFSISIILNWGINDLIKGLLSDFLFLYIQGYPQNNNNMVQIFTLVLPVQRVSRLFFFVLFCFS